VAVLGKISKSKEKMFRMVTLDIENQSEGLLDQVMGVELVQREPNHVLIKYKKIMSSIFLFASLCNLYLFASSIYPLQYEQIGFLKRTLFVILLLLVLYNMIYCFASQYHWFTNFLDNSINSALMTGILFLNLVLIDS
jgi:ABC-type protease/lipase transport system fused ATPase/permease subunit